MSKQRQENQDPPGSRPLKDVQHEAFVQELVGQGERRNLTDAYQLAYPKCKRSTARRASSRLVTKHDIRARIAWILSPSRNPKILSVERRKQILSRIASEIGDADPSDYMVAGKDGTWISFGPESPNRKAVAGLKAHTDENGGVVTEIKLHSPAVAKDAIDTLNKMDGLYKDDAGGQPPGPPVVVQIVLGGKKQDVEVHIERAPGGSADQA